MNGLDKILEKLPAEVSEPIKELPAGMKKNLEEVRIRNGNHVLIFAGGKEYELECKKGKIDNYIIRFEPTLGVIKRF